MEDMVAVPVEVQHMLYAIWPHKDCCPAGRSVCAIRTNTMRRCQYLRQAVEKGPNQPKSIVYCAYPK